MQIVLQPRAGDPGRRQSTPPEVFSPGVMTFRRASRKSRRRTGFPKVGLQRSGSEPFSRYGAPFPGSKASISRIRFRRFSGRCRRERRWPRRVSLRQKKCIRFIGILPGVHFFSLDSCASVAGWRRIGVEVSGLTSASSHPQTLTSSVSGEICDWHDHCDEHARIGKDCMRGKPHDVNSLPQSTKATDGPKPPGFFMRLQCEPVMRAGRQPGRKIGSADHVLLRAGAATTYIFPLIDANSHCPALHRE